MSDVYLVSVSPGAIERLKSRVERAGGKVRTSDFMSSTIRVSGMSRRALIDLPGVVYIQGDGKVDD